MTDKHEQARKMAEAALREQAAGNDVKADALLDEATRTDPDAVEEVLQESGANAAPDARDSATDRGSRRQPS